MGQCSLCEEEDYSYHMATLWYRKTTFTGSQTRFPAYLCRNCVLRDPLFQKRENLGLDQNTDQKATYAFYANNGWVVTQADHWPCHFCARAMPMDNGLRYCADCKLQRLFK